MSGGLHGALRRILAEASGLGDDEFGNDEEFVSLGLDSLFLTQLAGMLQNRYGVPVSFKQLVNQFPTVDALAAYLANNGVRVEVAVAEVPIAAPVAPSASLVGTASSAPVVQSTASFATEQSPLAAVFAEQLRLMERQLQLLQGFAGQTVLDTVVVAPTPIAVPAPSSGETSGTDKPVLREGFGPQVSRESSEIPEHVNQHIRKLAIEWNRRTARSKASTAQYRRVHADPRTASGFNPAWKELVYPLVVESARGARLTDIDGNTYIDLLNGFGPGLLGHNPPCVVEALKARIDLGFPIGPQTPLAGEVTRLICELTGNERATLVNTGSEAVAAALRVARTVTGRELVVVFDGDYHGNFDEVLVRAGRDGVARPMAPGIPVTSVARVRVLPFGSQEALAWIAEHGAEIAAVLVEPVQSRFPENRPREFMLRLRALTESAGACLIFDEVITGFRAGFQGAQGYYGVRADLVTYGKIVGGGMPIGVVAGKARFMDTFDGGHWQYGDDSAPEAGVTFIAGTFVRHPLAVDAAHAVLTTLRDAGESLYVALNQRATWLANALNQMFLTFNVDIEVVHFTSQLWFRIGNRHPFTRLLFHHVRLRGIYIQEGFPTYLTTAHTDADIEAVIDAFRESIVEMARDRVLDVPTGWAGEPFALASDQQDLWIASEMDTGASCAYNESDSLWLTGDLQELNLIRAWSILVARHQVFHLRVLEDGVTQHVVAGTGPRIECVDYTGLDEAAAALKLKDFYAAQSDQPFDLQSGPLHRAFLIRHAPKGSAARYQFVLYAHHLVHDGWTANVFFEEFAALYNALCDGLQAQLRPPLSYAEFLGSRTRRESDESAVHLDWWRSNLSVDDSRSPAFPQDFPKTTLETHAGATLQRSADAGLSTRLVQAARRCRVTQHTLMLGAFALLSAGSTGRSGTLIGVPRASQAGFEERAVAGMGVKLLPIHIRVDESASIEEFLQDVRSTVMDAQEHGVLGFSDLLRHAAFSGTGQTRPVIDAIFNFSHYFAAATFKGVEADVRENPRVRTHFRSFMHVTERHGRIDVDWDYSTEVFASETMKRLADRYLELLTAIAADPTRIVADLLRRPSAPEVLAVVKPVVADKAPEAAPVVDVLQRIRQHLRSGGERSAILSAAGAFSWNWLNQSSAALAERLRTAGVREGDTVAIATDRSELMISAMLAVLRMGANYLPVDQNYPEKRIAHVLSHSGVKVALTDANPAVANAAYDGVRRISVAWSTVGGTAVPVVDDVSVDVAADPGSPAYVIYTSGSTGLPKGVVVSRAALANYVQALLECPGIGPNDRVLAQTTVAFDIHVTEVWGTLAAGATLVLATQEDAGDGHRLKALIEENAVTIMQATPATWRMLKQVDWMPTAGFKGLIGGEAVPIDLVSHFAPRLDSLWNMYGPTEATVWASCCRLIADGKVPPIGKPLPGYAFHVLDDDGKVVPRGTLGELAISGVGLANGYHRDPEKTARSFPTLQLDGAGRRVYLTGDLVVEHPDGNFVFHARKDNQIKLRGHRIELGEVEHAVHASGQVDEAVAVLKPGASADDAQLVVFVVVKAGRELDTSSLRKSIATSLPRYMLPSRIIAVSSIPKTDNGKTDRMWLLADLDTLPAPVDNKIAPATPTETLIATIWKEMLGDVEVGREDSYFDVGGHSLMTVQFLNRLKESTGVRLRVRDIVFEDLQGIAALVDRSAPVAAKRGLFSRLFG